MNHLICEFTKSIVAPPLDTSLQTKYLDIKIQEEGAQKRRTAKWPSLSHCRAEAAFTCSSCCGRRRGRLSPMRKRASLIWRCAVVTSRYSKPCSTKGRCRLTKSGKRSC